MSIPADLQPAFVDLVLSIADDKLFLGHRDSDWTGLGPMLEEDIASSSIAQDEIAHAQALYQLIAPLTGRTADQLAFGRAPADYRCASIVELHDDFDWALALARRLFCDHFDRLRLARLARSSDPDTAALARRLAAEEQVHVEHVDGWIPRLGRGGADAAERMRTALDRLVPHALMLFEPIDGADALAESGLYPPLDDACDMFEQWQDAVTAVTDAAGLAFDPGRPDATVVGGRRGRHTPVLEELLDEMCSVYRLEPDAAW